MVQTIRFRVIAAVHSLVTQFILAFAQSILKLDTLDQAKLMELSMFWNTLAPIVSLFLTAARPVK